MYGERRWVWSFQDQVLIRIYKHFLPSCKVSPQHEYYMLFFIADMSDDRICELLPAKLLMRCRGICTNSKNSVEEQHSLFCPIGKITCIGRRNAYIALYFLVDVL